MTKAGGLRAHWLPVWLMLVSLIGAGQLLPAVHFLVVAHSICAEHGETLHAEPASEAAEPSADASGEVQVESAPAPQQHEHEHCSVLGVGSPGATFAPAARSAALPALRAHVIPIVERSAHVDIALLLYAPKLAPPA